jgi:hypothetical protein
MRIVIPCRAEGPAFMEPQLLRVHDLCDPEVERAIGTIWSRGLIGNH